VVYGTVILNVVLETVMGKEVEVFNPKDIPEEELPVIMGFNNGGNAGMLYAILLAEDGSGLGSHCCSGEHFMPGDLGILKGTRSDRHEGFQKHYPNGYKMEFVVSEDVKTHEKLNKAFELNKALGEEAKSKHAQESSVSITIGK